MTHAVGRTYAALLKERAPGIIRTRKEYEARRAEVRDLMLRPHRSQAQTMYLRLVATLLEAYEKDHFAIPNATPLEVLRHLMDEHGMRQADLATVVGSSGLASEIVNGRRPIGLNLSRRFAEHFNVPLVLFLDHGHGHRGQLAAAHKGSAQARKRRTTRGAR